MERLTNMDRIVELVEAVYSREKGLKVDSVADLGYIKMYAQNANQEKSNAR